jgi:hypothetical protein
MSNGDRVDQAQLEVLKSAEPEAQMEYLLTCAMETRRAVDQIPDQIATAISSQRGQDYRKVAGLAAVIAAVIGLATPYLLHIF